MADFKRNWFQRYGKTVTLDDILKDCRDLVKILEEQDSKITALQEEVAKLKGE